MSLTIISFEAFKHLMDLERAAHRALRFVLDHSDMDANAVAFNRDAKFITALTGRILAEFDELGSGWFMTGANAMVDRAAKIEASDSAMVRRVNLMSVITTAETLMNQAQIVPAYTPTTGTGESR